MKRIILIVLSILIAASLLLSACAPTATPAPQEPASPAEPEVSQPQPADEQPVSEPTTESEPPAPPPAEKIQISVEMSIYVEAPHKRAFDEMKARYEELNPNVEIVLYGAPYAEFWDKLTAEIVGGTEADIVQLQEGPTRYATYASLREGETGAFLNLDPYIKGTHWEEDLFTQPELTYNGHYIGMANYAWGSRAVYYRKSLFEKAGIDPNDIVTNEDFLEAARKLTIAGVDGQPGQYGFGAVLSTHSFVWDEMKTFICRPIGAYYFPDNAGPYTADRVIVNSEEMKWAWKWWQNMIFEEQVVAPGSYDKADERDLFWNGAVAMNIDGPWFVGMTREKDPALLDDLGVIASPDILYNGESYPFHGEAYAITHLISSKTKHPEEAWKFMEWMASEEAQRIIAVSGMIPTNINYSTGDEYMQLEPLNAELASLAKERYKAPAVFDPSIPQLGEMSRVMVEAAQRAFINGEDVDEVLDQAAEEIKSFFE